jgi:serine/threonine protein phosphatase 1
MFNLFRSTEKRTPPDGPSSIGDNRRGYSIGDINCRLDMLRPMIDKVAADDWTRGPIGSTDLILLGDYVDRGPASAAVLDFIIRLRDWWPGLHCLRGNHEEVFAMAARGDESALRFMTRIGGRETLLSYGASEAELDSMTLGQLRDWMMHAVPQAHLDFIDSLKDQMLIGDYAFVHAGIRPEVPMAAQEETDLRWIRDEFLNWEAPHDYIVVHGHSITAEVDEQPNRIGIDTGAYATGKLTALGLQATDRWIITTD